MVLQMQIWEVILITGSLPQVSCSLLQGEQYFWQPRLQKCVTLSITEAKYIAAVESSKEIVWFRIFL